MYGPAVDLWSAGVVLFILLGGYPPFYDENEPALFSQIRRGQFSFDDPVWDSVSERWAVDPTTSPSGFSLACALNIRCSLIFMRTNE